MSHKFISLVITKYFSCFFSASHVRDILRKSYGDEGPGGLGPSAVLNVPEGKYSGTALKRPPLGHKILVVITRWSH